MSQPEPNLTVVIPVHNAAPHLGACVESLLAQSYTDFELILVENGSSDDSRERCARYAAEHPGRIRTLTLDEASVSAARNAGIDNARGRFITFMDADDWAEKEFLAEFFRDPAPGPGTIVMQGILLDFSEAEPPGPNEAFFSYDDGALAIGDDPSAAVGQRFLQDGCSVCKLYHTETLRRLGIRFIEHLCSREDHLFFFTCISRMQSVVWRSGLYMHYMRRGRNTLSTRPMPACELVEAAERLDRFIPQLAERFGITDKAYLFALRQNLVRDTLLRAANNIRFGDRHYLVCFDSERSLAIRDLEARLRQGKLTFASPERMERWLGLRPGSVSPFGLINDPENHVHLFLDVNLRDCPAYSFHPNDNRATVVIPQEEFLKYLAAVGNSYEFIELY